MSIAAEYLEELMEAVDWATLAAAKTLVDGHIPRRPQGTLDMQKIVTGLWKTLKENDRYVSTGTGGFMLERVTELDAYGFAELSFDICYPMWDKCPECGSR